MKIEDYCAQRAYENYNKNYIADNKDNLEDIEQLNYKKPEDFIPEFAQDLRKHILTFLDDYEAEDRDSVRKGLTSILKNQFDDLKGNQIVDTNGKINVQLMNSSLGKSVEKELHIQSKSALQEQVENHAESNILNKEKVDFSKPKEKKAFLQNLFTEYRNLKTDEEKEQFKRENFYNYDKNKDIINLGLEVESEMSKIRENDSNISDNDCKKQACKTVNEKTGKSEEEANISYKLLECYASIAELEKQLETSPESQSLKNQITNLENEMSKLEQQLKTEKDKQENKMSTKNNTPEQKIDDLEDILNGETNEETEIDDLENILNEETNKETEIDDLEDILNGETNEETEIDDLENILNEETNKETEIDDLENILNGETNEETEIDDFKDILNAEINQDTIPIPDELKNNMNSILTGADKEDFADAKTSNLDHIQKNLPAVVNQNIFSKIKQTLSSIPEKINKVKENLIKFINDKISKPLTSNVDNTKTALQNHENYSETSVSETLRHIDGIETKTDPNTNKSLLESGKKKSEITVSEITTDRN